MKQFLAIIGILALVFVLITAVRLVILYTQVDRYKAYWQKEMQRQPEPDSQRLIVLGDSSAQGIGASHPRKSYVGLLQTAIAEKTGKPVQVFNLSVSGTKVRDVTKKQIPELQKLNVSENDVVVMSIGGNDAIQKNNEVADDIAELVKLLPQQTVVADGAYFGLRYRSEPLAVEAKEAMSKEAKAQNLSVAPLYQVTKSRNSIFAYSADLLHPSNRGYQNWFDAFWPSVENKLQ